MTPYPVAGTVAGTAAAAAAASSQTTPSGTTSSLDEETPSEGAKNAAGQWGSGQSSTDS